MKKKIKLRKIILLIMTLVAFVLLVIFKNNENLQIIIKGLLVIGIIPLLCTNIYLTVMLDENRYKTYIYDAIMASVFVSVLFYVYLITANSVSNFEYIYYSCLLVIPCGELVFASIKKMLLKRQLLTK